MVEAVAISYKEEVVLSGPEHNLRSPRSKFKTFNYLEKLTAGAKLTVPV